MTFLGTLGTLSILFLFYIFARLSERFGAVTKMPPFYRYYYVALVFLTVGAIAHILVVRAHWAYKQPPDWLMSPWFLVLAHFLPLTIGVTIGLVITWRYWSWLVSKRNE